MRMWNGMKGLQAVLVLVFAAGCGGAESAPVIDPEIIASPAATMTAATLAQTASPTPRSASQASPSPAPELITPPPPAEEMNTTSLRSPDGRWTAQVRFTEQDEQLRVLFQILDAQGSPARTLYDQSSSGLGYGYPLLKHWSADSRSLYYALNWAADGCSELYSLDTAWQRVDIETGEVIELALPSGRAHTLSPDGTWLAYIAPEPPLRVVVERLDGKQEAELDLDAAGWASEGTQAGDLVWSPDGASLALALASDTVCGATRPEYALARIDWQAGSITLLAGYSASRVMPLEWPLAGRILVRDWNGYTWWIDDATGEVTTAPQGR